MNQQLYMKIQRCLEEGESFSFAALCALLETKEAALRAVLREMEAHGEVVRTRKGNYALPAAVGLISGVLEVKRGGFGFVRAEGGDIFIPASDMMGAMNGERVQVRRGQIPRDGRRCEGVVVRILSEEPYRLTGTLVRQKRNAFVCPDDHTIEDVLILQKNMGGAKNRQKVVVEITRRRERGKRAEGKIIEILGLEGDPGVDILSVARARGLRQEFPEAVTRQIKNMDQRITQEELRSRETLFQKLIVTIDGADAKDLDDAVSLERLNNGNYLLGVHIADVSHYVREDTPLDREAVKRGTSVYLIDRVIPMLPKELSNGICSLNPREVRLTLSCFMEISQKGRILSHRITKSAILSRYRMTYDEVNRILEGDRAVISRYADAVPMLREMAELAALLRKIRFQAGSIDFDIDEAKILLDDAGHPIEVGLRNRGTAEKLIEEFMLACNNTVAEEYFFSELPFLYRVHETPDTDKMKELGIFLSNFGYKIRGASHLHSKALQEILTSCEGTEHENIISRVMLRSLKKARYCTENLGHFGLASHAYTHFTSPIRRYPDLQIHRIIKENLEGKLTAARQKELQARLGGVAERASERERNAIEAERKVEDIKKAEYLSAFEGKSFEGIVSGVASSAIFVELPNTVEGVIPLSEMREDYYVYHKDLYCVIGERTKRRINLGDRVMVVVRRVDPKEPRIEFRLKGVCKSGET